MSVNNLPSVNPYAEVSGDNDAGKPAPAGPTPKRWAGKFNSPEEMETGHDHLQHTLTERTTELENERRLRSELEQVLQNVAERMSPADRMTHRSAAEETLINQGLPLDAMDAFISERIARGVGKALDEKLAPLTRGAQTQQMLEEEFPNIDRNDVDQFLRSNPDIRKRYSTKLNEDVTGAMYYAYAQFAQANRENLDLSGQAEQQARRRRDAMLPSSESVGHQPPVEGPSLADQFDNFLKTGDKTSFLMKRLEHIQGIKPTQR
jgi:hypothetical protein